MQRIPKRFRIGFVADWDAGDPDVMSGASYFMRRTFLALGHEVIDIFPTSESLECRALLAPGYLVKKLYEQAGFYYSPKRNRHYINAVARFVDRRIQAAGELDFIFSQSAIAIGGLQTDLPVFMTADQPFGLYLKGYIPRPARRFVDEGCALERRLVLKVDNYIFPSEWARTAFCEAHPDYSHISRCVPWGANLNLEPDRAVIERDIESKSRTKAYNILFLGRDWSRKRGDLVLKTVGLLRKQGYDVTVDIVGAGQVTLDDPSGMTVIPSLSKSTEAGWNEYVRLMRKAHFLFVPSRAEAYGHVFCEAAAFGVPSISTAVGGITTIVKNWSNGICLPLEASETEYAAAIAAVLSQDRGYENMAKAALADYDDHLSWLSFCRKTLDLAETSIARRLAGPLAGQHSSVNETA